MSITKETILSLKLEEKIDTTTNIINVIQDYEREKGVVLTELIKRIQQI